MEPSGPGFYKINFDASYHQSSGSGGWGCVVRNNMGNVLHVGLRKLQILSSPPHAEAEAATRSIERAVLLGITHVVLETDATILGKALRTSAWDGSQYETLFRKMRDLLFFEFTSSVISVCTVCSRNCNQVAHSLAAHGASLSDVLPLFMDQAHDFVTPFVSNLEKSFSGSICFRLKKNNVS
ncbi:hypothetical protein HU200_035144 [Digitaria exilis]|uniref:RNase H type-1 domain-containing protein n=1 Tax=Digitaria exilis TaxID=1010633 RepID=A0A835BG64_9POAL|nr:hypothetical protein HU200_035144 [Digitaria exilis]